MALTAAEPKGFQEELKKAVSLAPGASKGEHLIISARQAYYLENNPVKSNELYRQLAEMFPNDKRAHLYLAYSYSDREEKDKAIAEFEKAIALDKDFATAHYQIAYVYYSKDDFAKAEQHFKVYLQLAPKESNPHDCLADLYQKMGRFDDAISHYQQAVKLDPHFSMSQSKIGSTYVLMGRYEEGRQAFEKTKAMELEPANKVYDEEGIARSYIYAGDFKNALEGEDKAIRMAQEFGLPQEAAMQNLVKCMICCELKDYNKAAQGIADCRKYLADPKLPPNVKENYSAYSIFFEGFVAIEQKDLAKAAAKSAEFKARIAKINEPLFPKYAEWLDACIALAKGDGAGADARFSKVTIDDPFFIYYAAVAKEKAGDSAGAKKLYTKVANWNADNMLYGFVRNKAKAKI
jgi:tetratricopeptide (TPR) repeat protein